MRLEFPEFSHQNETLVAIVLGALLATISGVIANQLETFFRRRERERSAALLFGELLSTLRVILENAESVRHIGEPYGPVTRRMLHAARREMDIYDRNREALVDLRDAGLRVEMHTLMVRIAMPLDGMIDSLATADGGGDERDSAMGFIKDTLRGLPSLVTRLGVIARHNFKHYDRVTRPGVQA